MSVVNYIIDVMKFKSNLPEKYACNLKVEDNLYTLEPNKIQNKTVIFLTKIGQDGSYIFYIEDKICFKYDENNNDNSYIKFRNVGDNKIYKIYMSSIYAINIL